MLQSVLDEQKSAPRNVLRIIETISKHNNTPRKKPKFINFVKNVCGQKTNPKDIDQAWDLISVKLTELSQVNNQNRNQNQKNDSATSNGDADPKDANGETENGEEKDEKLQNGNSEVANGESDEKKLENGETETVSEKKMSKKQRKEEKKRQKYEAELQSAEVAPAEEEEESQATSKKGKKKKNRTESLKSVNDEEEAPAEGKNKHKKRKRQDTVNAVGAEENDTENIEIVPINKEKTQKKKLKVAGDEAADKSLCLHDQNVAKSEEATEAKGDKFDWHAVIFSVLSKKDSEMPFKRLQKKVLSEYTEMTGREVDDRIADKFIKKLKSAPKVRVDKNRVYIEE